MFEVCALHVSGRDAEPERIWEGLQEEERFEAGDVGIHFWMDEQEALEAEGDETNSGDCEEEAEMGQIASQASSSSSSSRPSR